MWSGQVLSFHDKFSRETIRRYNLLSIEVVSTTAENYSSIVQRTFRFYYRQTFFVLPRLIIFFFFFCWKSNTTSWQNYYFDDPPLLPKEQTIERLLVTLGSGVHAQISKTFFLSIRKKSFGNKNYWHGVMHAYMHGYTGIICKR